MIIALVAALFTTPHTSAQEAATSRVFGGECTYRRVKSLAAKAEDEFITVKAPMEILNINVLIAAGEPHLHVTLSADKGTFGGHLEKGCRVPRRDHDCEILRIGPGAQAERGRDSRASTQVAGAPIPGAAGRTGSGHPAARRRASAGPVGRLRYPEVLAWRNRAKVVQPHGCVRHPGEVAARRRPWMRRASENGAHPPAGPAHPHPQAPVVATDHRGGRRNRAIGKHPPGIPEFHPSSKAPPGSRRAKL
jgi:hypothetical protein